MRADDRVEDEVRPEPEHAEGVGIDRPVQQLRQRVIRHAEREKRKPHAHRVVHVEPLHGHFAQAVLIERNRRRYAEDRGEDEGADRVPVRDIDVLAGARHHGCHGHDAAKHDRQ